MGNYLGSSLIQSLRNSANNTLLLSKTSAFPPVFTTDIPGTVRASVTFNGFNEGAGLCSIVNSTNVLHVSSTNILGEYVIVLAPGAFAEPKKYTIEGSISCSSTIPLSAANGFFIKDTGYTNVVSPPTPSKDRVYIQTYYSPMSQSYILSAGPSQAYRVSLNFYKNH